MIRPTRAVEAIPDDDAVRRAGAAHARARFARARAARRQRERLRSVAQSDARDERRAGAPGLVRRSRIARSARRARREARLSRRTDRRRLRHRRSHGFGGASVRRARCARADDARHLSDASSITYSATAERRSRHPIATTVRPIATRCLRWRDRSLRRSSISPIPIIRAGVSFHATSGAFLRIAARRHACCSQTKPTPISSTSPSCCRPTFRTGLIRLRTFSKAYGMAGRPNRLRTDERAQRARLSKDPLALRDQPQRAGRCAVVARGRRVSAVRRGADGSGARRLLSHRARVRLPLRRVGHQLRLHRLRIARARRAGDERAASPRRLGAQARRAAARLVHSRERRDRADAPRF